MTIHTKFNDVARFADTLPEQLDDIFDAASNNIPMTWKREFADWLEMCRVAPTEAIKTDRLTHAVKILFGLLIARLAGRVDTLPTAILGRKQVGFFDQGGAVLVMGVLSSLVDAVAHVDEQLASEMAADVQDRFDAMFRDIENLV
jgi:hypothetical protein